MKRKILSRYKTDGHGSRTHVVQATIGGETLRALLNRARKHGVTHGREAGDILRASLHGKAG